MHRLIVISLLCWNCLVLLGFVLTWAYISLLVSASAPMCVTELDRHQVIDHTELNRFDPDLARSPRRELGLWIAEEERAAAKWVTTAASLVAGVNVVILAGSLKSLSLKSSASSKD